MNDFSLYILIFAGFLIGIIFKDLLKEYGAGEKFSNSYLSFLVLPFMVFIGYVFVRVFYFFQFSLSDLSAANTFASTTLLWIAAASLVGGMARFAFDMLMHKKRAHKAEPAQ